jgi:hypothetical protein
MQKKRRWGTHLSNLSRGMEKSLKDVSENDTWSKSYSHSFDGIENRVDDVRTR